MNIFKTLPAEIRQAILTRHVEPGRYMAREHRLPYTPGVYFKYSKRGNHEDLEEKAS